MAYGRVYFAEHLLILGIIMKLCKDCKYAKYTTVSTKCSYNADYAISPVNGKLNLHLLKSADKERDMSGRCKPAAINFKPIDTKGRIKNYSDTHKPIIIFLSVVLICIFIISFFYQ